MTSAVSVRKTMTLQGCGMPGSRCAAHLHSGDKLGVDVQVQVQGAWECPAVHHALVQHLHAAIEFGTDGAQEALLPTRVCTQVQLMFVGGRLRKPELGLCSA
jgi:hypothetical protein